MAKTCLQRTWLKNKKNQIHINSKIVIDIDISQYGKVFTILRAKRRLHFKCSFGKSNIYLAATPLMGVVMWAPEHQKGHTYIYSKFRVVDKKLPESNFSCKRYRFNRYATPLMRLAIQSKHYIWPENESKFMFETVRTVSWINGWIVYILTYISICIYVYINSTFDTVSYLSMLHSSDSVHIFKFVVTLQHFNYSCPALTSFRR